MLVTLSGIVMLVRLLQSLNASSSILVTVLPLIFDGITTSAADLLQPVIVIVLPDTLYVRSPYVSAAAFGTPNDIIPTHIKISDSIIFFFIFIPPKYYAASALFLFVLLRLISEFLSTVSTKLSKVESFNTILAVTLSLLLS